MRISKGSIYKDFYYLISKPFWPGKFQKEIILESLDKESLINLNLLKKDNIRLRQFYLFKIHLIIIKSQPQLYLENRKLVETNNTNKGSKDGVETGSTVIGPGVYWEE